MGASGEPTSASLEQSLGLGKRVSATLRDGQLHVELTIWSHVNRYRVPARDLYPHTNEYSWRNRKFLTAAAILLVLAILTFIFIAATDRRFPQDYSVPGAIAAAILLAALVCIVGWCRSWCHYIQVIYNFTGEVILAVIPDVPSKNAVDAFLDALLGEAREIAAPAAKEGASLALPSATAAEIRRFHALWRRGLLTEDEFRDKKRELLTRLLEA